jgi:hypothetical protein
MWRILTVAPLLTLTAQNPVPPTDKELILSILEATRPLPSPRGERLPLFLWPAQQLGTEDEKELESLLTQLEARGISAIANWRPSDARALESALRLGRIQKRLGLPIAINATASTYAFFNGDLRTAHLDAQGKPFFDSSFTRDRKMGCPFAIDFRLPLIKRRIEEAVDAYRQAELEIYFLYADWEVDGPLEWNGAWASSKRCRRCRERVPNLEDFAAFQAALRTKRSELQKAMLAEPVLTHFPKALVGNYGVYPHEGYRYWYDYFEKFVEGAPHRKEGRARYRKWFDEFPLTGYTFAMPVLYPWYPVFGWYDFDNPDYRWFYNLLLEGSSAGKSTPAPIPLVPFVHWHTTEPPKNPDPRVKQLSRETYQELLWHLLLRGHDTFFLWSPRAEALEESRLVHEVYRASHEYRDFLLRGTPLTFEVPKLPGPVVSASRLGSRLLVRRTDFDARDEPVRLMVDGQSLEIPRAPGRSQLLERD